MVNFPNNPDKSEGEVFYQVRYFCKIKELLPQTLDPDTGLLYERKFVPLAKLNDYLKWGAIADEIVASSIKIDDKLKLEKSIKKGKKTKTPRLVILMGLPGCGKSYVASYLYEKYGFTILSGENITYALFGTEKCANDEYALAYKTLRQLAAKLLADGYSVVIDGTNLKYAFRQQIYDEVICDSTTLIYLKIDDKTALNRITQRGLNYQDKKNIKSSISQETFNNFKKQLEEPLPSEKAITIISDDNIFIKIDSVVNY
jgi:predicted kinase